MDLVISQQPTLSFVLLPTILIIVLAVLLILCLDGFCTELIVHLVFEYIDQDLDSCIRHSLPRGLDEQTIKVSNDRGKGKEGERNVLVITSIIIITTVVI